MKKYILALVFLLLLPVSGLAPSPKLKFHKDINKVEVSQGGLQILSQDKISCEWRDPESEYRHCTVVLEVLNSRKGRVPLTPGKFKVSSEFPLENLTFEYSTEYETKEVRVLNRTCAKKKLSECYITSKENFFNTWREVEDLSYLPAKHLIGVKLEFLSPVRIEEDQYLLNKFNFTLLGKTDTVLLDPTISACSSLTSAGSTYTLNASVSNSAYEKCMNITADNITLNCQNNLLDGVDGLGSYGIYSDNFNTTLYNCDLQDWDYSVFLSSNSDNSTLKNITSSSQRNYALKTDDASYLTIVNFSSTGGNGGFYLDFSYSKLINSSVTSGSYGIVFSGGSHNEIVNVTLTPTETACAFSGSSYNILNNSLLQSTEAIDLPLGSNGYNQFFNNLINGSVSLLETTTTYWNTSNQTGSKEYGGGAYLGGNYWTNSTATGFSDTCTDTDKNGLCDSSYTLSGNHVDYLPLSYLLAPYSTSVTASPSTPTPYLAGRSYFFNSTWTDAQGDFANATLMTNCTNGTLLNFTEVSDVRLYNESETWFLNLSDLAAQSCVYRWFAQDTADHEESTSLFTYEISKLTGLLDFYINGSSTNRTIKNSTLLNLTLLVDFPSERDLDLWKNSTKLTGGAANLTNYTTFSASADTVWNLTAAYNSSENYSALSETLWLTQDVTQPRFLDSLLSPTNSSTGDTTPSIYLYATDTGDLDLSWYSLNSTTNSTLKSPNATWTSLELSDGTHTITFYLNDTAGNENSTTRYFTVDSDYPGITINLPENEKIYTSASVSENLSFTEAVEVKRTLDGGETNTTLCPSTAKCGSYTGTFNPGGDNTYTYRVYAIDDAGHETTDFVFFTRDTSSSGGGGGDRDHACGDGYCAEDEDSLSCPEDCLLNFTKSKSYFDIPAYPGQHLDTSTLYIPRLEVCNPNNQTMALDASVISSLDSSDAWSYLNYNGTVEKQLEIKLPAQDCLELTLELWIPQGVTGTYQHQLRLASVENLYVQYVPVTVRITGLLPQVIHFTSQDYFLPLLVVLCLLLLLGLLYLLVKK